MLFRWLCITALVVATTIHATEPPTGFPKEIIEIRYPVPEDESHQPALFWSPTLAEGESAPLLVALHTWSGDYRQQGGQVLYANWCLANDWIFLHPNFRGRNNTPEAMGSDLVIADIRAAVEWAKKNAAVDEDRIYAMGGSGGGHAALLLAGRLPNIWAGVSAWCPITSITDWHAETSGSEFEHYARHIEAALGGPPGVATPQREQAEHRSPLTWLTAAQSIPLDINHGIHDGKSGSVPFTHSLHAWNTIVPKDQQLSEDSIDLFYTTQKSPEPKPNADSLYGTRQPVFRRTHKNTRVTVFEGGHEIIHLAGLNWLAAQHKGTPANWEPEKVSDLDASDADTESGK
ncbi:MAG: prolyl oligopeptidase family serine peptidase [Verrucomicrobiota bacterium]